MGDISRKGSRGEDKSVVRMYDRVVQRGQRRNLLQEKTEALAPRLFTQNARVMHVTA